MSFRRMLDHTADIVRPTATASDDPLGDERPVFAVASADAPCAFWPIQAPLADYGAGEGPMGRTGASFLVSADIEPQDFVVTKTGPESPKRWRVLAKRSPGRRFGRGAHHHEVEVEAWTGTLAGYDPEAGS